MQWNDAAIILSIRKFAEHGAIVTLFSREHGLYSGVCKSALSKAQRGIYQSGNWVHASWKARLEEHIGTLNCELEKPVAALVMQDRLALMGLNAMCSLLPKAMHERDPHPVLFDHFQRVLDLMVNGYPWLEAYVRFEMSLLAESGFGLDLSSCAATGQTKDLIYVSPRSGCAVSAQAGEPYKSRLLPLPSFLLHTTPAGDAQLQEGLYLTGYFLQNWLLNPHGDTMPDAREQLIKKLQVRQPESCYV